MAWGTPTATTTLVLTSSAHSQTTGSQTIVAGRLAIIVGYAVASALNDTIVVSDTNGGTWTVYQGYRGSSAQVSFIAWSIIGAGFTSKTITIADTSTVGNLFSKLAAGLIIVSGNVAASAEDTAARAQSSGNATTTPTITSGTPANSVELFIAVYGSNSTNTGTYTEDGNWTNLFNKTGGTGVTMSAAYLINASNGTETHAPTTASQAYNQAVSAFIPLTSSVNSDNAIPLEFNTDINSDENVPVEWQRNTRNSDAVVPIAFGTNINADENVPEESAGSANASPTVPVEFNGGDLYNAVVPMEFAGSDASTAVVADESGGSGRADSATPIEFGASLNSDNAVPVEWGRSTRTADIVVPIAFVTQINSDAAVPEESGASSNADTKAPIEFAGSSRSDARVPMEFAGQALSSQTAPVEFAAGVGVSENVPIEWVVGVSSVVSQESVPIDFVVSLLSDSTAPLEFGTGVSAAGWTSPFEWETGVFSDALVPLAIDEQIALVPHFILAAPARVTSIEIVREAIVTAPRSVRGLIAPPEK